jgi:lipopolysaccharide exporter
MTARDPETTGLPLGENSTARMRRLSHGATWSLVNTLVTRLAGLAITVVVVRIVSPHDFGVFTVAAVVYAIVSSFGELGLSACIVRRDVNAAEAAPVVALLSMASGFVLSASMALLAGPLAAALGAAEAEDAIRVLSICVFLSSLTTVSYALLARDFRQGRMFSAAAIAFIPSNALLILLALNGDGALNYTLLNADFAFIGSLLGPTLLGIYTLAFSVASWSTAALGSTINGVAMPAFSALRSNPERLKDTLARWSRLVALVAFPVAALTAVMSVEIVSVLYGAKWIAAAPVLAILAVYGAVFVVSLLLSNLLVGLGRTGRVFVIQAVWLGTLLGAVWLGVVWLGVEGAAIAHVVVIVVIVVPTYLWALKPVLSSAPQLLLKAVAGPLVAATLAGGVAYLAMISLDGSFTRLVVGGTAGVVVYLVAALHMIRAHLPARVADRLSPALYLHDRLIDGATRRRAGV